VLIGLWVQSLPPADEPQLNLSKMLSTVVSPRMSAFPSGRGELERARVIDACGGTLLPSGHRAIGIRHLPLIDVAISCSSDGGTYKGRRNAMAAVQRFFACCGAERTFCQGIGWGRYLWRQGAARTLESGDAVGGDSVRPASGLPTM
jgi:hypothetical protein